MEESEKMVDDDFFNDEVDNFDMWFNRIQEFDLLEEYQQKAKQLNASTTEDLIVLMKDIVENMEMPGELKTQKLSDILNNGIPEQKWRVNTLVPERGLTFLGGTAGSFKTWNAMDLAMCCATGKPYLNYFDVKKCKVLYIDEENGDITIPNRFESLRVGHSLKNSDLDNLSLAIMSDLKLNDLEGHHLLDKTIEENNFKVIVIDSMVRCMNGNENDATEVRTVFNNVKRIMHKYQDVSFIILHHTVKGGKGMDALRGSGDFAASADIVLMLTTAHKGFVNIEIAKNRHIDMEKFNKFSMSINNIENGGIVFGFEENEGFKDLAHSCAECIKDWYMGTETGLPLIQFKSGMCRDEMKSYGYKHSVVFDALKLLVANGKIKKYKLGVYDVEQSSLIDEK